MKVHDIRDADGRTYAFEVSTFFLDRRAVRQIVRAIPGASSSPIARTGSGCASSRWGE